MVSARKVESNRANAKKSTGPKSTPGKAHAAQNARRHGLNVPVEADRLLAEQVKSLAQEIVIEMSGSELTELASRIAEAEVDLLRIRQMSLPAIADRLTYKSQEFLGCGADLTKELMLMDRYQRRALSRRKFAIRAFDLARHAGRIAVSPSAVTDKK
jgi:hypothetical protein